MPDPIKKRKGLSPSGDIHLPSEHGNDYGKHPYDIPKSALEKFIVNQGFRRGTLVEEDIPYLEQYMHPDKDVLEKQELRPTKGGTSDLPYRHTENFIETYPNKTSRRVYNTNGLGNYKRDTSHPDYNSIFDRWDFETESPLFRDDTPITRTIGPSLDSMAKKFLQMAGKPYNVYERVPKESLYDRIPTKKFKKVAK